VDLTISPDWDARWCYGVVFLCAVLSARVQVLKRFSALNFPTLLVWRVPNTWLIFLVYLLLPMALFWFMDRMGALSDTSLFSALLVGLAYPAILAGGFGGLKGPSGLDGILKPLTLFVDSVVTAVNRKLARNEKKFEDYLVKRMMASDKMLKQMQELAESAAGESTRLKDQLAGLDKMNMPDKRLLTEKKARAIYLRLSAMPDFIEIVTRNQEWMGPWWRSPIRQAQGITILMALLIASLFCGGLCWVTQPKVTLMYHVWRLGKANNSTRDRGRAMERLRMFLQDATLGPASYQSLTWAMHAPDLPAERVDLMLQLVLQASIQPYHDKLLCGHLIEALHVDNVDARVRIHQALIYLAEKRDTKDSLFKVKEKELADWNPTAGDSVPNLEKRMDQWRAFFGCNPATP
jgi:hypothetical protein